MKRNRFTIRFFKIVLISFLFAEANCQIYLDSTASVVDRVEDLLGRMSLAEKIGQMTQVERYAMIDDPVLIADFLIGSVLSGGGSAPDSNTPKGWADIYDTFQSYALQTPLKIPIIYGIDAVHGNNNLKNSVIFPHNIGMGCTRNPELAEQCARITALEVSATGIDWTFSPVVAVPRDERWGRTYEGFGETPELAAMFARAAVLGYQTDSLGNKNSIAACAKHFLAEGGTTDGVNTGNAVITEEELRAIHLQGYITAIDAGVATIMTSVNQWNGEICIGDYFLLTQLLKEELGFKGFVVSDWNAIEFLGANYSNDVYLAVNAGMDMAMVPYRYQEFITTLTELVNGGDVLIERIDDAVRRILRVKFQLGLFEHPYTDRSLFDTVGCVSHREIARQAVRESLVLLKNNGILPLQKTGKKVLVVGSKADDIGIQCGGWTISWQGSSGDITKGTTVVEAIRQTQGNSSVDYSRNIPATIDADLAVVVIGESPYAESYGDTTSLGFDSSDLNLIDSLYNAGIPFITVLLSGRPLIINDILDKTDALVAAWLPGTEGLGITDVLYGDFDFKGKLSNSWPYSMEQIPVNYGDLNYSPLFEYGYGLTYGYTGFRDPVMDADKTVKILPNPATEYITIQNLPNTHVTVELINVAGSVVRSWEIYDSNGTEFIPLENIDQGIYFIKMRSETKMIACEKLLIKGNG